MKLLFAYFTDIHGNIDALQAVVDDAIKMGARRFICGGDMIGIGPFTNEVLELLFNLPSVDMVIGNHDEAVLSLKFGLPYPESHFHAKKHHQWIANHLEDRYANKLHKLPRELKFVQENIRFLITHYPFKRGKKESPISEDPFMPIISQPDTKSMHALFGHSLPYDFIGFGHHHIVHDFKIDQTHFVNPGALGCNAQAEARYALVYEEDQKILVEYNSVPYDRTNLFKAYRELQVPDGAFLMKAFHS
ncbi:metallophosphoesterase family protein [Fictibacillus sp. UD]|uniref:metallophosphoesterase family protein n=1 Tax=Fictibacillus sp. UD TaxID=3038777 RepID=UPI0037456951